MNLLFTFKTFADVFSCERIGKAAGLFCRAVSVPRSLGITCEYAAEIQNVGETDVYAALELLRKNNLSYTRVLHSVSTPDGEVY